MHPTPYSVVREGGVLNIDVTPSPDDATLHQLYVQHKKPIEVPVDVDEYHGLSKTKRNSLKKKLPYFVGAIMNPPQRKDTNVSLRTLITLDIEKTETSPEHPPHPSVISDNLRELGKCGWVYPSISHLLDAPRYRVVLPLSEPITGAESTETLKATTLHAARVLGVEDWLDSKSWTLSQPMYLPAKLEGTEFKQWYVKGDAWNIQKPAKKAVADIPDERLDPVLTAIKKAELYLGQAKEKGRHFICCPFHEQHGEKNGTQTMYMEAHYNGNKNPNVNCFDSNLDTVDEGHLTYDKLVRWLKDEGHLTAAPQPLDDYEAFDNKAGIGVLLDSPKRVRDWAIQCFAPVGKVTVVGGPGGVSKSALLMHVIVHAAMGESWGAFHPTSGLRSLFVSYEDDNLELSMRIKDIVGHLASADEGVFDILNDVGNTIRENVFMYSADDETVAWILLSKPDRFSPAERTQRVEWLVGWLKSRRIRMLVLDPAVYTHRLEENNIADMAEYIQTLGYIAKHAQCAVIVLHHMNKAGAWAQIDDINQSSLRGASSFADDSRSVVVMVSMPIKDAPAFGLPADHDTLSKYVVVKHVKHNYSAPMPTQIFERKGRLLIPRPDIVKLDGVQLIEAREHVKQEQTTKRVIAWAPRVLAVLADHDGPLSQGYISTQLKAKSSFMKEVLEWAESQDYVEISAGPNRSRLHELTNVGARYLKGTK